jgi:hypothetical protein
LQGNPVHPAFVLAWPVAAKHLHHVGRIHRNNARDRAAFCPGGDVRGNCSVFPASRTLAG